MSIQTYSRETDGERSLSENFKVQEFASKCGADTILISSALVQILQTIRDHYGRPVTILSGYRSPSHNRAVGGAPRSQHVLGTAADIVVDGISPRDVYTWLDGWHDGGLGRYDGFTHVDVRPTRTRWRD